MSAPELQNRQKKGRHLWSLAFRVLSSDWAAVAIQVWQLLQNISAERRVGLYEALDFEHTRELCDPEGKKAVYHKRETVRLLQDHVAAYLDQIWGRGDVHADYRCSPGVPVDRVLFRN